MENKKRELLSILLKLKELNIIERQYINGWLDAKLEEEKEVS